MSNEKRTLSPVEPVWSTYIHAKGAALGLPIAGNFELTSRCNFNCKMCYVHNSSNVNELSAKEWIEIGKKAVEKGMVFLLLTGGEPFLRKDFKEIYLGLKKLGLMISINTNGSLIDDDMFRFLVQNPPTRMNISLYGCSDETYRNLCGKAEYGTVTKNIKRLHEAGISVRLNASITPYNAEDIEGIYRFAKEVGVQIKATTYMFPPVRVNGCQYGEACHRFDAKDAAAYMLKCQEQYLTPEQLANNAGDSFFPDDECNDGEGEHMRCRAGKTAFWVTWDGRMLPCGMFPNEGYSIKKIGFEKAWEEVKEFTKTVMLPAKCTNCSYKSKCPVCAASCLTETGDSRIHPEYICEMTKMLNALTREKYNK